MTICLGSLADISQELDKDVAFGPFPATLVVQPPVKGAMLVYWISFVSGQHTLALSGNAQNPIVGIEHSHQGIVEDMWVVSAKSDALPRQARPSQSAGSAVNGTSCCYRTSRYMAIQRKENDQRH
jgi:hypothetical protein